MDGGPVIEIITRGHTHRIDTISRLALTTE